MRKIYQSVLNLGVHDGISVYQQRRVRFANFLELFTLLFYCAYTVLGFVLGSAWWIFISFLMLLSGILGFYMNKIHKYEAANTLFLGAYAFLLLCACNSLDNGHDFIVLFMPSLIAYVILYDFRQDLPNILLNLSITVVCFAGTFLLPAHLITTVSLSPKWISFFHTGNYVTAFGVTLGYMLFIANHINKNSKELMGAWMEAERQKEAYLEEKNRAEAATAAKSQFLSNMSHELRTPLNGIIGTVHLLLQDEMMPAQKPHFKVLKYSSEHMLSLINDVLDFSKIEAGQMDLSMSSYNLKQSLEKLRTVFEKQFAERSIKLNFDISSLLNREFTCDETRLNQVLTNLISNALKFSKRGTVKCSAVITAANSQSAEIYFAVEDTGIGISSRQQQYIFDAFRQAETSTTRRFGGTGLGLTISKKIVDMLGGNLEVKSQEGKGSCFYFTLNLQFSQQKAPFVNDRVTKSLQSLKGARILMADDSSVNRRITRSFLERWEVIMDEAVDGKEAVQLFFKNKYDVLLIDLHMPVMDGYETISAIRKVDNNIPAIAFTAAVIPDMRKKLTDQGFTDFLQKPFRPEDLHKKIITYQMKGLSAD